MNARDDWSEDPQHRNLGLPGDAERSLPVMLVRARDAVMSHFKPLFLQNRISEQQWRVMRVLRDVPRLEAHEVAARAGVLSPSLSRIARSLETRGIIARTAGTADRRQLYLSLTPKGHELMALIVGETTATYVAFVERFGRKRLDTLFEMLADMSKLGAKEKP
jgi:homoprotocatechuate degradation regulator HpaR